MFQFPGLASRLAAGCHAFSVTGCPIRKSADIMLVCSSPQLIAAYHVLHRLSEPRHSPYALNCFKKIQKNMTTDCDISVIDKNNTRYYNFFPICQRTSLSLMLKAQGLKHNA